MEQQIESQVANNSLNIILVKDGEKTVHKFIRLPEDEQGKKIFIAMLEGFANEIKSVV